MTMALLLILTLTAYLLGSCPNGLLVARTQGIDIRAVGSGNIGATNVFRSVGKAPGILVFFLDASKGLVPALVFPRVAEQGVAPSIPVDTMSLVFGAAAIAGHTWPIYLRFRGGKGVATSAGVLIGIAPAAAGIGMFVWLILVLGTRYVSVGSMGAALTVAISGWLLYARESGPTLPIALTILAAIIFLRHRSNLRRLANGTENRISLSRRHLAEDSTSRSSHSGDPSQ